MKKPTFNTPNERHKTVLLSWDVIASTLALVGLGVTVIGLFVSPNSKTTVLVFATGMSGAAAIVTLFRKKEDKK